MGREMLQLGLVSFSLIWQSVVCTEWKRWHACYSRSEGYFFYHCGTAQSLSPDRAMFSCLTQLSHHVTVEQLSPFPQGHVLMPHPTFSPRHCGTAQSLSPGPCSHASPNFLTTSLWNNTQSLSPGPWSHALPNFLTPSLWNSSVPFPRAMFSCLTQLSHPISVEQLSPFPQGHVLMPYPSTFSPHLCGTAQSLSPDQLYQVGLQLRTILLSVKRNGGNNWLNLQLDVSKCRHYWWSVSYLGSACLGYYQWGQLQAEVCM